MGNSFNIGDWIKQKLEDKKNPIDKFSSRIKSNWKDIKNRIAEIKDDSHHMVPILNGFVGDTMKEKGSKALVEMSFRYQSRNIEVKQLGEYYNFSKYNGTIVIMVHGLWNDESIFHSEDQNKTQRLGTSLEKLEKANVIFLRYNTGLHISQNGRSLSNLLQQFMDHYDKDVKNLILIGHSMGGLVTRSACYYADIQKQNWISILKKIFLIGVPNEGSYLAKGAHMTQYFFRNIDPTDNAKIAKFFDIRSNGIKDLSFGYLVDEDWKYTEGWDKRNPKTKKVYPLPNVNYYLIAGTVANEKGKSRIFTFFGDGLVEKKSALSKLFETESVKSGKIQMKLFTKENHLTLLESEKVLEYILKCLGWT